MLAVYCFAFKIVGFPILTPVMLFLEMFLMMPREKRSGKSYAFISVLSIAATAGIFIVFYYGLKLMLPAGILKYVL